MTQGAPTEPTDTASFSATSYLSQRGLTGTRRMEFGGEWFEFMAAAPSARVAAFSEARAQGDLLSAMRALLVDEADGDRLAEAFQRQPQPIEREALNAYVIAIVNFLVAGDAGESSAS